MAEAQHRRVPKVIIHRSWTLDKEILSEVENIDVPEALMSFADQVRGNAGVRVAVTTDFGMKDFGNGASGSVTISIECNQDDQTITHVANSLSQWTVALAEQHFKLADVKFQEMFFQRHPDKAAHGGPPLFKP